MITQLRMSHHGTLTVNPYNEWYGIILPTFFTRTYFIVSILQPCIYPWPVVTCDKNSTYSLRVAKSAWNVANTGFAVWDDLATW
jgi:hypothetical protein